MANGASRRFKVIAMLLLVPLCGWLVYRNLLTPGEPTVAASLPKAETAQPAVSPRTVENRSARPAGRRGQGPEWSREQLAALDPTLRLDLLEKSRRVKYAGPSRNIFQFYTPPAPAPVAPPPTATPAPGAASPPAANIPLKFYGMAIRPDTAEKKAFLTNGDEIFIGQEGDLIAKQYKIIHIGVNTIELEDTRTHLQQQLTLAEE